MERKGLPAAAGPVSSKQVQSKATEGRVQIQRKPSAQSVTTEAMPVNAPA